MNLTLTGVPSPKKNSKRVFNIKGKVVVLPSQRYVLWHDRAWIELKEPESIKGPCSVIVSYWMPDNRGRDLTNLTESVMDLLVDKGVIEDDKWQGVPHVTMQALGIDRENPRTEIRIDAL